MTCNKKNMITKLQKLYIPPRNLRAGNKLPILFLKKPLCTGDLLPVRKIFVDRPEFAISICKFWSTFCPETDNPFILLYMNFFWLNIQDNNWRRLNVLDGCVGQTLSQEIFRRSWNNFDFVPPMIYDTKAMMHIVYCKCFWAHRKSIFIGSVRPIRKWLILWISLTSKGKVHFSFQWITR